MAIEVTPNNPEPEERVLVRLTVTNAGSNSVVDLEAQVDYPTGLADMPDSFISDAGDCTNLGNPADCDAGETASWDIGTLEPGAGKTVYLSPTIIAGAANGLLIPFEGRVVDDGSVLVTAQADAVVEQNRPLELAVDVEREPVAPGEMLRYVLNFGNKSGVATTDSELRFPLPVGTSLVEASDGGTLVGDEVLWDLATLNPGDSDKRFVTVQLDGSVDNGDLIEIDAAEISGESNFETQRTRQQATTRVETASALAFSIDMPAQPLRNDVFSPIHVTVTNRSETVRSGVRAELFFPPGLNDMPDSLFSDGGNCTNAGNPADCDAGETAFWDIGTLPPGAGKTVTLVPFPTSNNADGRLLAFFGRAFADGTPDFWERRTVATRDQRALNLEIDAENTPVPSDATISYRVTVGNQGESAATSASLTVPIPAGTSVVSAEGDHQVTPESVIWNIGTLNAGQATRRNLTLSLDAGLNAGDILELGSGELRADGMPATRNATSVRTRNSQELNQTLSLVPETALPGSTVSVTSTVNNDSEVQITDVETEIAVLGQKDLFDIGQMNPGGAEIRSLDFDIATGGSAPALGSLLNFTSRLRSSSTDGDFQTRTLIVGEEIEPGPVEDAIFSDRFESE